MYKKLDQNAGAPQDKNDGIPIAKPEIPKKENMNPKRRKRPRTKAIRTRLKTQLEKAILSTDQNTLKELLTPTANGNLIAPMSDVFPQLSLDATKFTQLSVHALKSVSKTSRIFDIAEHPTPTTTQLSTPINEENKPKEPQQLSSGEQPQLWLVVQPNKCGHLDDRTVFLDNLPAQCTQTKLERRCAQFGSIISIHFPQIRRIQRRIAQTLGRNKLPVHSGFAFIQFASKTAAKRLCKRYAANSRLKRAHHHGTRHHAKKGRVIGNNSSSVQQEQQQNTIKETVSIEVPIMKGQKQNNEENEMNTKEQQQQFPPSDSLPSPPFVAPIGHFPPPKTAAVHQTMSMVSCSSTEEIGTSTVRTRCYSVAESTMSVDESGKETDLEEKTFDEELKTDSKGHKKKSKNRRKKRLIYPPYVPQHQQTLNSLFRHIQVFSLKQYKELRTSYLNLKKTRIATLKKQLQGQTAEKTQPKSSKDKKTEKGTEKQQQLRKGKPRSSTHAKRRGIQRLMNRAEKTKVCSLHSDII